MILLASHDQNLISHYRSPLADIGETQVVTAFAGLLWYAARVPLGVALIDRHLPGFPGLPGIALIRRTNPNLKLLLLGDNIAVEEELASLAAGVVGNCGTSLPPERIRQILTQVGDGGIWISNAALPHLLERLKRWQDTSQAGRPAGGNGHDGEGLDSLTPREREIVYLVAKGASNKLIARELNISDRTVKSHLSVIFQKLRVRDRLQLALLANRQPES